MNKEEINEKLRFELESKYKKEKISHLLPFGNVAKATGIIGGFFLIPGSSMLVFFMALLVTSISFAAALDLKKFRFSRPLIVYILCNISWGIASLFTARILLHISSIQLGVMEALFSVSILFFILIVQKHIPHLWNNQKLFYVYRLGAVICGWGGYFLSLFLIQSLGLVTSLLLSFLGNAITLVFGYLILKEIPSKKDVLLCLGITALVSAGYILK